MAVIAKFKSAWEKLSDLSREEVDQSIQEYLYYGYSCIPDLEEYMDVPINDWHNHVKYHLPLEIECYYAFYSSTDEQRDEIGEVIMDWKWEMAHRYDLEMKLADHLAGFLSSEAVGNLPHEMWEMIMEYRKDDIKEVYPEWVGDRL